MIDYEKIKLEIEDRFKDIDDAIARLRALFEPEPKDKPESWEEKHIKSVLESRRDRCKHESKDCPHENVLKLSTSSGIDNLKCFDCGHLFKSKPECQHEEECEHYHKIPGLGNDFMCSDCDKYIIPSKECQHEPEPDKPRSLIGDKCRQHVSDGKLYANYDFSNSQPYKCIKCGEFYR